jgi:hypothetical protein
VGARIIAICDSFSAMTTDRIYKPAMSMNEALAELRRCAGTQFDPRPVDLFCRTVATSSKRGRPGSLAGHNNGRGTGRGSSKQQARFGVKSQPDHV